MNISPKVQILNFFRRVWMIPGLESVLARRTRGLPADHWICKLVPNPYQYQPGSFRTIERDGIRMRIDISDYIGHYLYFAFKDRGMDTLFSLCGPDCYSIDVGTNIGWTFLNLAHRSPGGKAIGFEPDPFNYNACKKNLELSGISNAVLLKKGLGEYSDKMMMEVRTPSNRGGNRISPGGMNGSVLVTVEPLDQVDEVKSLKKIDLIKIDVEGYELHVLKGAGSILTRFKPVLFIELDDNNLRDQGHSAQELLNFLRKSDYNDLKFAESGESIAPGINLEHCHFDLIAR